MDYSIVIFKTVRAPATPAPVGSTPMRPRHPKPSSRRNTRRVRGSWIRHRAVHSLRPDD